MTASLGLAPLRAWEEFFPGTEHFSRPDVKKDWARWNDRVVHNLLYYQTNYFVVAVVTFLVVALRNPVDVVMGAAATAFWAMAWGEDARAAALALWRRNSVASALAGIALANVLGNVLMSVLRAVVLFFAAGIVLPLALAFAHASLRSRNAMQYKMEDKGKEAELKRSPMGVLLAAVHRFFEVNEYL